MKKFTLLFTILLAAFCATAQNVAINNDGTTANGSAMLDVKSITKGFLMPRMTSAQRSAISLPVIGLLVFDTDTKTVWAYNGTAWTNLSSAGGGGALSLPYDNTVALAGSAFKLTNSGTSIEGTTTGISSNGIRGNATANGSNGVYGISTSTNGVGVRGEASGTGTGVLGYSTNGTGISASSISGTGIYTNSISGLALNVNGKLKIAGGNTNPSAGAVLTSDASGNAVWNNNRVGFSASGHNASVASLYAFPANTNSVVHFTTKEFDYGNDYVLNTSTSPSFGVSIFVAPKTGTYHFDAALSIEDPETDDIGAVYLKLRILRVVNGSASIIYGATSEFMKISRDNYHAQASFSKNIKLIAGDIVNLEVSNVAINSQMVHFYAAKKRANRLNTTIESVFIAEDKNRLEVRIPI